MRGFFIAAALALVLLTPCVAALSLIAQSGHVSISPAMSKGLFLCRTHRCVDQTCAAELARAMIIEQPKRDAAAVADPCHPDPRTFPEIGTGSEAD